MYSLIIVGDIWWLQHSYSRRWTMKSKPCCIVATPASPNFNVAFGLRACGRLTKNQTLTHTQRKLYRDSYNIEIWGLGALFGRPLLGLIFLSIYCLMFRFPTWMIARKMTAKKDDCKNTMTARKQWLQRTVTAKKCFWRKSRTKAVFSQLNLAVFEASLARQRHIQNFKLQELTEVSHESFFCKMSTCRFWRSRKKASFSWVCS